MKVTIVTYVHFSHTMDGKLYLNAYEDFDKAVEATVEYIDNLGTEASMIGHEVITTERDETKGYRHHELIGALDNRTFITCIINEQELL